MTNPNRRLCRAIALSIYDPFLNKVGQVVETDTRVLVLGETSVGKDLFFQAIHLSSGGAAVGSVGGHSSVGGTFYV
ncbi:MAG: sigma 54-interacting transcriptional regulator [Gemmatimonadota bacterium]|nr:sigma 54-interacting transcriptional regulator [Gemmatimonadota bacterium]